MLRIVFKNSPKLLSFYFLLFFTICSGSYLLSKSAHAKEENLINNLSEYIKKVPDNNFYILGPGDNLYLSINEDTKELNGEFFINGEGFAVLPRLNRLYVQGLTIKELTFILNNEYSKFVLNPNVELILTSPRAVEFYIEGEVEETGRYLLPGSSIIQTDIAYQYNRSGNKLIQKPNNIGIYPTLIDSIKKSGGISLNADLSNITITRINSLSNGSGRIKTKIDLMSVLNLKDSSQNIRILDGDTITIPRAENKVINDINKAIKSNLNPKFIDVNISGRVRDPGIKTMRKLSSLNDAVALSGGTKVIKGPVKFIRFNNDGSVDKRKFNLNNSAKRGSYNNPYLSNGDVIFVGDGLFASTTEVLSEVTSPFQSILSIVGLIKLID